jgi:DNA-binding transcriptional MerR regulator
MRIGELAAAVGVSTDTVRFYERSGWLPRAARKGNAYREYGPADVEHVRLIIDLRRLDLPLEDAARIAGWCHAGHCADTTTELPRMIDARRAEIAERIAGLQALDARLADLHGHLDRPPRRLAVLDGPCCEAADAVVGTAEGMCACCSTATVVSEQGSVPAPATSRASGGCRRDSGAGRRSRRR